MSLKPCVTYLNVLIFDGVHFLKFSNGNGKDRVNEIVSI